MAVTDHNPDRKQRRTLARRIRSSAAAVAVEAEAPVGAPHFSPCEPLDFTRQTRAADPTTGTPERVLYDIVVSSERAVRTPWGEEVLGHGEGEIDLSDAGNGISWLLEHGGNMAPFKVDPDFHAGLVSDLKPGGSKLRGAVEWGSQPRAVQAEGDFRKGLRPFTSVGWLPGKNFKVVVTKRDGKPDLIRITGWRPVEVSSVSVPADFSSRKGRSGPGIDGFPVTTEGIAPVKEETMEPNTQAGGAAAVVAEPANGGARAAAAQIQGASPAEIRAAERRRVSQIEGLCERYQVTRARAQEYRDSDLSVQDVIDRINAAQASPEVRNQPAAEHLGHLKPIVPGVSKKEGERYSIVRAANCALTGKYDGLEGRLHNEMVALSAGVFPGGVQGRSVLVPLRIAEANEDEYMARRTRAALMGTGLPDGGAAIVSQVAMEPIDILRNASFCTRLGARTTPVTGQVSFAKKTGAPTVRRMQENPATPAPASGGTWGFVLGTPKTYIGVVPIPRQLLATASFDVEADMRKDLVVDHALALDYDGIYGDGTANAPQGIYRDSEVQSLDMETALITWAKFQKAIGMVASYNVPGSGLSAMTTPPASTALGATLKTSGVSGYVWEGRYDDGNIGGYRAVATNQMSQTHTTDSRKPTGGTEHGFIVGDFANLDFLLWGALLLQVDDITLADYGQIRVISTLLADVVNKRPKGFVVATGMTVPA